MLSAVLADNLRMSERARKGVDLL